MSAPARPTGASTNEATVSRCPVDHARSNVSSGAASWNPMQWIRSGSPSSSSQKGTDNVRQVGVCPVKHSDESPGAISSSMPSSLEESERHAQTPFHDQRLPLSTHRVVSSIPRADELRPDPTLPMDASSENAQSKHAPHQPAEGSHWVYPSEQQFYNAMRRKGWQGVDETTIPTVVRIHNAVNEKGWSEVRKWERELHDNPNPRLVKFLGRPNDMSPKAWFNTNLLFYNPPFDRHDWYVDRGDDKEPRRYVIDFYNGEDGHNKSGSLIPSTIRQMMVSSDGGDRDGTNAPPPRPPAMYLDVRPALDEHEAVVDRFHMFFREAFPGLFAAFGATNSPTADSNNNNNTHRPPMGGRTSNMEGSKDDSTRK